MTQRKKQIKTPLKELSDKEIDNLSDAEFKTLLIRMLTEMIEYGWKIEEEVKAMQNEIKENTQARPPENQHQGSTLKDAIHLWEVGEVTESGERSK